MGQNFLSCDRDQVMLLPPDLQEWLPAGHLARFVIEVVDQLDLRAIYDCYRKDGHGRPAHEPGMMVALLLYSYAVGVRSSRVIERRCVEDVPCRVITANRRPDHTTISRFRARHQDALSGLFYEVLALCRDAGMVRVGTIAIDSTKLAANASAAQNRTYEGLRQEAKRILEEAGEVDAREDELYGQARGDELPAELADPRTRAGRIRELLERARAQTGQPQAERAAKIAEHEQHLLGTGKRKSGRPPSPTSTVRDRKKLNWKYNLTDPDSAVVRHRGMLIQGYSVQTAAGEGQIVLAVRAHAGSDQSELERTVREAELTLRRLGISEPVAQVLADSGYYNQAQIRQLQAEHKTVLVPPPRIATRAEAQQMRATLDSDEGKRAYRRRQALIEPVFAYWGYHRGITRLLRRGKHAVQAELDLIATTHNLLKLHTTLKTA